MTVIRPNSISGVTSITALANEINVFRHNGVLAGLQLNGVNHHTSAGVSTFHTVNVLGNLDVAGVLTYQDVTNVDSLGIGTFRTGINVSGGQLDVGSDIKLGNAGVITATSFVGSGANLTGLPAETTINNNANNRIITGSGTANTLEGESNFTYDGNEVAVYAQTDDTDCVLSLVGKTASGGVGQAGRTAIIAESSNNSNGQSKMHFRTRNTSNAQLIAMTIDGNQKVGIGISSPDQTVHIHKGSAGSVSSSANTVLTLENSTTNILQFLNPNNTAAQVRFGDPQDDGVGFIEYSHNANTMSFGVYGPTRMQIDSNGHLGIAVASGTQLANSLLLTLRPTDGDGIRFVRPGDTSNSPSVHLDLTTTTSGSTLRSGGEAYTTKYHGYNNDLLFRSYEDGGTGGIIRFVTSDTDSGTQRFWQIDEDGMTTHRSKSSTVKTHEFSYTGGAGGGTLNVNLLSISGYVASSTAVVKIEYVGMYGLAGSYISQGIWLCSYRRANGGSAANALAQQTHNSGSNSSSNVTIAWVGDNLRLTVGAFTGFTVHVTATVYNATINVLV